MIHGIEALNLSIELQGAWRLFIEVETPRPHLVTFPLDGIGSAVKRLDEVSDAAREKRFDSSIPTAPPPAYPSSTTKIEQDIASWNPRSSIPLKRGAPMSISQSNLDSLKKWAGKYPIRLRKDKGVRQEEQLPSNNFFELPYIRQELTNLLDDNDFKKIATEDWAIVPIKLVTDYLVIKRCRPHGCTSENAILAVSLHDGSMHVGFWNEDEKDSRKIRWFSTKGDYKDLPKEVLDPWYNSIRGVFP
jgi:hypothetical protein